MAGAGYRLFNTGDVLTAAQVNTFLQEQVVMVFNDAAARTTALSGVLSEGMVSYLKSTKVVEIYNGTAWASLDDPNAIQNTIVDAKGDLIAATGNDVPARLAVGSNGETLVADSATSTGLRYIPATVMANPVINGGMDIWARGTSVNAAGSQFGPDRWNSYRGGFAAGITVSRQDTNDTTNLPFIQYCARIQRNSGNTGTDQMVFIQNFENVNSTPFIGKTVTLSFYARAGANFSATSNAMTATLRSGTATDEAARNGVTGSAFPISQTATLTTSWQRFSFSGTVASTAKQLFVGFEYAPTGTAGAADFFEVTGVQIDVGQTALPFRRSGGTIQGELAACQRYYYLHAEGNNVNVGAGGYFNANLFAASVSFPVTMRIAPSLVYTTGTGYYQIYANNGTDALDVLSRVRPTTNSTGIDTGTGTAGTLGHAGLLATANAASSIAFNAEL